MLDVYTTFNLAIWLDKERCESMIAVKQDEVLIDDKGNFLQMVYEYPETIEEGQSIVALSNYYEVLNEERFDMSVWDFAQKKWIGKGEQRPILEKEIKFDLEQYMLDIDFRLTIIELGGM